MITSEHHITSAYKTKYWLVEERSVVCILFPVMDLACDDSTGIVSTDLGALDVHEGWLVDSP